MSSASAADIRVAWRACHGLAFVNMDSPVQPPASTSQAKGYATIALASAAGVIVASRMNRPALMLAAGLALSWWRRQANATAEVPASEEPAMEVADVLSMVIQDTKTPTEPTADDLPETPSEPAQAEVFTKLPQRPAKPPLNAWDDLRAAISPGLGKISTPAEPLHWQPDFSVSPPSSPMISAGELEAMTPAQSIYFAPLSDEFSNSISLPIIAEIESRLESGSGDFMLTDNELPVVVPETNDMPESLAAGSQEVQSRKTFFDWLRN